MHRLKLHSVLWPLKPLHIGKVYIPLNESPRLIDIIKNIDHTFHEVNIKRIIDDSWICYVIWMPHSIILDLLMIIVIAQSPSYLIPFEFVVLVFWMLWEFLTHIFRLSVSLKSALWKPIVEHIDQLISLFSNFIVFLFMLPLWYLSVHEYLLCISFKQRLFVLFCIKRHYILTAE